MLLNNFWAKYCCSETTKEKTVKEEKIQNKNERGLNMKTNNFFGNIMGNLQFGRMETDEIKYSFKGISYKTDNGDYVCYDSSTEELTNVNQMVFDMPIMVMPIPKKDLNIGDVIKHNDKFVIVKKINEKNIEAIKPNEQELVTIIPMKSIFGFDFYSKVVNFLEGLDTDANQDNPFGKAMLPMLMMGENKDNNMNNILPLMMMNGGDSSINSLLPMLMMGGEDTGNTNNMLPLMMMMQMNKK